jgi:hypothetical protein
MGKWIIRQFQNRPKPLRFLWNWAKRAKGLKGSRDRWRALTLFAYRKEKAALEAGDNAAARHWHSIRLVYKRKYRKKRKWLKQHQHQNPPTQQGDLVSFDGHQVARWMVEDALKPARASGSWKGVVFSGFRDPAYSTQLCLNMCGRTTCPGQCAGASSNHSCPPTHTGKPYEGAVDVTDTWGLQAWCAAHGYPIRHTLPNDLPHFSRTGQ